MDPLRKLIKRVKLMNGKKVILIGHSLGGVVIETYMRMYSDW
jgi:alpha-beta hydrolase superfamily lysophospholipase